MAFRNITITDTLTGRTITGEIGTVEMVFQEWLDTEVPDDLHPVIRRFWRAAQTPSAYAVDLATFLALEVEWS